jgi:TusA-related sulfurtransferase
MKIIQRLEHEVAFPKGSAGASEELVRIRAELLHLVPGMVLEFETGDPAAVRGTKSMLTRAGKQVGVTTVQWHQGTRVFVKLPRGPAA